MDVHGVGGRDAQDLGLKVSGARAYTVTQCAVASPIGLISPQLMSKNDARRKKTDQLIVSGILFAKYFRNRYRPQSFPNATPACVRGWKTLAEATVRIHWGKPEPEHVHSIENVLINEKPVWDLI